MFLKFKKPKYKKKIAIFDLLDDNDLIELNKLMSNDIELVEKPIDRTIPGTPGGFDSDATEAKLLRIITYLDKGVDHE